MGGDLTPYEELGRWLREFANMHAKKESPRVEALVEMEGEREGTSYGLRLRHGTHFAPPLGEAPMEFQMAEVAANHRAFAWCAQQANVLREVARGLLVQGGGARGKKLCTPWP